MKRTINIRKLLSFALPTLALLLSAVLVLSAQAQGAQPPDRANSLNAADATSEYIPIQGYLTDSSDHPLNGFYSLVFRIYDVKTDGTPLCTWTAPEVSVTDGLFTAYINAIDCAEEIDGRQLYLGIQVGDDAEMAPRAYIDNVPYAWSLRPGAIVRAESMGPTLQLYNSSIGAGLRAHSSMGAGVWGSSVSGYGLMGESDTGAAIVAKGTGIIASTAESYLWVSGNAVRPHNSTDATTFSNDTIGGMYIRRGSGADVRYVMLPITIPGELYGQNITLTDLDLYWVAQTSFDVITDVRIRRQTGTCPTCYVDLYHDGTDHTCEIGENASGCTMEIDLTTNNEFSSTSGVLYLGLGLQFNSDSSYIDLSGVRLTLTHIDE